MPKGIKKIKTEQNVEQTSTPTIKPVDTTPEVVLEKPKMVTINIDRQMTDGGLRTNGKLYVGNVTVTEGEAEDLMRRQDEYFETKKKLMDKNINVRMKSDFQKETLFLVDPSENAGKKGFTRDYGMLGALEWSYCKPKFQEYLLEQRRQLYGY